MWVREEGGREREGGLGAKAGLLLDRRRKDCVKRNVWVREIGEWWVGNPQFVSFIASRIVYIHRLPFSLSVSRWKKHIFVCRPSLAKGSFYTGFYTPAVCMDS
jgi:hypothetical protein